MNESFVRQRRVEFRDTDAAGIMHFSTFFVCMEQVEHEFLRSLNSSVMIHLPQGDRLSWPRVGAECRYLASLRFEELFDVSLQVRRLGRTSVTYAIRFARDELLCAEGQLTVVHCRIVEHAQPEPIPPDLCREMERYLES